MANVGSFSYSNDELNAVQHAAEWGLHGNTFTLPSGCTQHDGRTGWASDAQLSARALSYNFNAIHFYEKWLREHDEQLISDRLTLSHTSMGKPGDPSWTVTRVLVSWAV